MTTSHQCSRTRTEQLLVVHELVATDVNGGRKRLSLACDELSSGKMKNIYDI